MESLDQSHEILEAIFGEILEEIFVGIPAKNALNDLWRNPEGNLKINTVTIAGRTAKDMSGGTLDGAMKKSCST